MSEASASPVGLSGRITTPTRGANGAGEVVLRIRGGSETFLARSSEPLAVGCEVVVVDTLGPRTLEVVPLDAAAATADTTPPGDPHLQL